VASARPIRKGAAVLAAVTLIALVAIPTALAAFGVRTQNEGDIVNAAADFTPPGDHRGRDRQDGRRRDRIHQTGRHLLRLRHRRRRHRQPRQRPRLGDRQRRGAR
jgi:hypothetical protein